MTDAEHSCPLPRSGVLDAYFLEHRAKLIDIAAFLDRADRARPDDGPGDFRLTAFVEAVGLLIDGRGDRARRVLELFSDPSSELAAAAGTKGACGAVDRAAGGRR